MSLGQAFLEALESLSGNKLRSGLTVLGIVIGVAAVIAMLAVGRGAEASITGSISGIGTNLLFVFRGDPGDNIRNPKPLTTEDANALRDQFAAPSIAAVAPALQGDATVSFGGEQTSPQLFGVTPEYFQVRNLNLAEGEMIAEEHMLGRSSVVLLGPEVAESLFGHADGITGETVRIEGQPFRVIGVLESKGGGAFGSEDNQVLVPFTTAQTRLIRRSTSNRVDIIFVQAVSVFIRVDLPEPEGPMMAITSPRLIAKDTPRKASTSTSPILYTLRISWASITLDMGLKPATGSAGTKFNGRICPRR